MKKIIAKINVVAILIAFSFLFVGCGLFFNPSKYVDAYVDAIYKGNFEDYSKMTSSTTDQIQKKYDACCESQVDVFAKLFGFTDESGNISVDDAIREQIKNLYKELYGKIEYTVEDSAEKIHDGYIVHVSVSPILIFEDRMNQVNEFVDQYNSDVVSGKYNDQNVYSQEFLNTLYQQKILEVFNSRVDDIRYGESENIDIRIMKNNDKNSYYINADDLVKFSKLVVKYPL